MRVPGPVRRWDGVVLADTTMQDEPEWTSTDGWVTEDSPILAVAVPPTPAFRVGAAVPADAALTITLDTHPPAEGTRVHQTVLRVGGHGCQVRAGAMLAQLSIPAGDYPAEVWVDGEFPAGTRQVWIVLGDRTELRTEPKEAGERRFLDRDELHGEGDGPEGLRGSVEASLAEWVRLSRVQQLFARSGMPFGGTPAQTAAAGQVVTDLQRLARECSDPAVRTAVTSALSDFVRVVIAQTGPEVTDLDLGGPGTQPAPIEGMVLAAMDAALPAG